MKNQPTTTLVPLTRKDTLLKLANEAKWAMASCASASAGGYWSETGRYREQTCSVEYQKVVDRICEAGVLNAEDIAHVRRSPHTAEQVCRLEAKAE